MHSILPALNLCELSLDGNSIGTHGTHLISNSLAKNPCLERLYLKHNLVGDGDAKTFANSLATNTNLRGLYLAGNPISQVGIMALSTAQYGAWGFDDVYNANHTCFVGFEGGLFCRLSNVNINGSADRNRRLKVIAVLSSSKYTQSWLREAPIGIMPKVIAYIQLQGALSTIGALTIYDSVSEIAEEYNGLNEVFKFIREWNMPLLYTSSIGPQVRRSQRIRNKNVVQLMAKKATRNV